MKSVTRKTGREQEHRAGMPGELAGGTPALRECTDGWAKIRLSKDLFICSIQALGVIPDRDKELGWFVEFVVG